MVQNCTQFNAHAQSDALLENRNLSLHIDKYTENAFGLCRTTHSWHMHAHYIFRPKQPRFDIYKMRTFWDSDQTEHINIGIHTVLGVHTNISRQSTIALAKWEENQTHIYTPEKKKLKEHNEPSIFHPMAKFTTAFSCVDVNASDVFTFLFRSIALLPNALYIFRAKMFCKTFFFSVAFRHVCHFAQNKTKPKPINYISDAGGIYHDIIQYFFSLLLWVVQRKKTNSNTEIREQEKKYGCSTKCSSLFIDSCCCCCCSVCCLMKEYNETLIE